MESFWKEYTINLPGKKEYIYDIQNKDTNCIIIRNYNITKVKAGIKPHSYEIKISPNRTGLINRPFPLNYVYFLTTKPTPVTIIETVTQNPINDFIQQQVTKNIIIQNAPKIDVTPVFKLNTPIRIRFTRGRERRDFTFDLGEYGRTNINLHVYGYAFCFRRGITTYPNIIFWTSVSNDNIHFFGLPLGFFGTPARGTGYFRTFKNFPYRFLRLTFFGDTPPIRRIHTIYLKLSFSR